MSDGSLREKMRSLLKKRIPKRFCYVFGSALVFLLGYDAIERQYGRVLMDLAVFVGVVGNCMVIKKAGIRFALFLLVAILFLIGFLFRSGLP